MNNFFTDDFYISKIDICVLVERGKGQSIHKVRKSHGLVIQLDGENEYIFEQGGSMKVYSGELFYLPKFSSYSVVDNSKGSCIAINFDLIDKTVTYPFFKISSDYSAKYTSEFRNFLDIWNNRKSGYMNVCLKMLYGIICSIQSDSPSRYLQSEHRKIAHTAKEYITAHLCEKTLSISEVSEMLSVSPEYFRMLFREAYGESPRKYIINMRISKAKELIHSEEFLIGQISSLCGFDSASYFCSEFKRITSYTPSEYMRLSKKIMS